MPENLQFDLGKPLSFYANKNVMLLISILKEISGSKKPTNAATHAEFIKKLAEQNSDLFVLAAGLFKSRNWWEMARELNDKELAEYLADIPAEIEEKELNNILAEKFLPVANKLEQDFVNDLKQHLNKLNLSHIKIHTWSERQQFKGFQKETKESNIIEPNINDLEETKKEFLKNKKSLLKKAKDRMINAQPNLKNINFDELTKYACYDYMLEEHCYFKNISESEILHRGKVPAALKPVFSTKKNLHWQAFSCKESIIKKSKIQLARSLSTPALNKIQENHSLAERRLKFFVPLKIPTEPKNKKINIQSASISQEGKWSHSMLSPKTEHKMRALIELFSKSPPEHKKLAMLKIEEATRLLELK